MYRTSAAPLDVGHINALSKYMEHHWAFALPRRTIIYTPCSHPAHENMPYANVNSKCIFYSLVHAVSPSRATSSSPIALLFIHGLGSSSSFYVPLVPRVAALGYVCLAIDTHGSGSSPYSGSGNSIISIASDAGSVLDVLGTAEN